MSNHPPSLEEMLAAWNEQDPAQVRSHLDVALDANVRFVDPDNDIVGIDAFEKMVHAVHDRIPGAVYSRTSDIDSHHNLHRYHWAIHHEGRLLLAGFDVTEVNEAGKVTQVLGFFGPLAHN